MFSLIFLFYFFVPLNIILGIALYVSFESNVFETTWPFRLFIIYVSVTLPFAPFCFISSVPTGNVLSSVYFVVNGIVEIVFVSNVICYSVSSFIP